MTNADQIVNVTDSREQTYGYKQRACGFGVSGQEENAGIQAVSIKMARVPHSINLHQMTY
jgi:hypothetical protein